ncbi:MAG: GTP cyclohydrolase II [Phycicoccus sp.]
MTYRPPAATVRTAIDIPLRFPDGYETLARVLTFDGLAGEGEHLVLALGDRARDAHRGATGDARRGAAGDAHRNRHPGRQHGDAPAGTPGRLPLVRLHSECLTGDVFGSQRCDCGAQLREAVERIADAGGYLLYLRQEGRGIGLYAKLDAYALQDVGLDTYEANLALGFHADARDYTAAAQMLHALGASEVALLSNNPDKAEQLSRLDVTVTERVRTQVHRSPANAAYLHTKATRGAHTLASVLVAADVPLEA